MPFEILVDNREKKPYKFPGLTDEHISTTRLDVGDYTLRGLADTVAVERKTLDDLASSFSQDRDRFEREIQRAESADMDELVVVIEAPASDVYDYAGAGMGGCDSYWSDIAPNSVIGTVEKWPEKYDSLEFVWANNRPDAMQETLYRLDMWYVTYKDVL